MDLSFGLLFHRFKTIFDWKNTVYCCNRNQQMQSKYSCSQSQGNARLCLLTCKINKQTNVNISEAKRETQFPQEAHSIVDGHDVIRPEIFFFFGGGGVGKWCRWKIQKSQFRLHYKSVLCRTQLFTEAFPIHELAHRAFEFCFLDTLIISLHVYSENWKHWSCKRNTPCIRQK